MKRLLINNHTNNVIVITVEMIHDYLLKVSAESEVTIKHRGPIRPEDRYSDEQLEEYSVFIGNVYNVIASHGFDITRSKQSSNSYSYYIDFYPIGAHGEVFEEVKIIFRIADHPISDGTGEDSDFKKNLNSYLKNFHIGTKRYPDAFSVTRAVSSICDGLAKGDYSSLEQF